MAIEGDRFAGFTSAIVEDGGFFVDGLREVYGVPGLRCLDAARDGFDWSIRALGSGGETIGVVIADLGIDIEVSGLDEGGGEE